MTTAKFIVKKGISAKNGNPYAMLMVDFGYRKQTISFDTSLCAELLGASVADLMTSPNGEYLLNDKE